MKEKSSLSPLDSFPLPDPMVVGRIVPSDRPGETEAVLVIPARGKVKVLNDVGARIWQMVDGRHSVRDISAKICEEYEVGQAEAEQDTLDFLNDLAEREIISYSSTPR
jgi:hypothetical protein